MYVFTKTEKAEIALARKNVRKGASKSLKLLTAPDANPKLDKNSKRSGILTSPLHLSPANISGFEVCPMASKGCRAACLHTAGNPIYMANKHKARIDRTKAYFNHRNDFMIMLVAEIAALERKAEKEGMFAGVRLNATSDIPYENVNFIIGGVHYKNIMEIFPNVTFYDYTKRHNRKNLPVNYHLTFSLSEENAKHATTWLESGGNVAVVFDKEAPKQKETLPSFFVMGGKVWPVINGDFTDYRPDDGHGVIVGLKAKGDAKGDLSGFVQYGPLHDSFAAPNIASKAA